MTIVPDTGRKLGGSGTSASDRRTFPRDVPMTAAPPQPTMQPPKAPQPKAAGAAKKEEASGKKKKKGGKKKILIIALVVVLLAGGVYYMKFKPHAIYKAGEPVPNGKVISLGTITANTAEGRLVQVGIAMQMSVVANAKQEATDAPQLTNAVISNLANWTYTQLLTNAARTSLQSSLLTEFQQILGPVDGAAVQINAVYFTSFILQ